jgi:thiol-disulfide isomerase/thioredoxin/protocatechuate 3,4-dioxygenase beta subunit
MLTLALATVGTYGRTGRAGMAKLVLLTLALCGLSQAAAADGKDQPRAVSVEARDLVTDAPVPDVRLQLSLLGGKTFSQVTDASGEARFVLSDAGDVRYLLVRASREGFVPQAIHWDYKPNAPTPPERLLFQMEKGTTMGGRVVDEDKNPVAGATVVVSVRKKYPKSNQWVAISFSPTRADANGVWSFANVPEAPDAVEVGTYHHLCLADHAAFRFEPFTPLSALRDGSAVVRLQRGTRVEGTVVGPDGQPVSGAEVLYGEGRQYANSVPPVKTDDRGNFVLGIKPGEVSTLTATHPGFGPAMEPIKVGREPLKVRLALPAPSTLSGRVVDLSGKPIADAFVQVESWRKLETLSQRLTTGEDGRFAWNEAPGDEVVVRVFAKGYMARDGLALNPGSPTEIVLTSPTTIKGTVVDAETGKPVPEFSLLNGAVWKDGQRMLWQRGSRMDEDAKKGPGSFEYTFGQPAHKYVIRVHADDYLPEESGLFSPDGTPKDFTFRLKKGERVVGLVRNPDGSPAREGFVYLVPPDDDLTLVNGDVPDYARDRATRSRLSSEGRFSFPPQKGSFLLVALNDAGFAFVHRREFRGDEPLRLRSWARVSGTVKVDQKPEADLVLSADPDSGTLPVEGEPRLGHRYSCKTDANGRFELNRVVPGRHVIGQWVPNGVRKRIWFVNMATIDAESGRSLELKIGDSGRPVTGRLALPTTGDWMVRKASIGAKISKGEPVSIGVRVFEDGRFRAEDLGEGDYVLRASIHEPPPADACGWGRLIGEFTHEFRVTGNASDGPLDLGRLQPAEVGREPLQVGERAPDFQAKTLEGMNLSSGDFAGKFVLLDFWATWCAPCVAELPHLKALHEAYGNDPRFAIVSLSLDEKPDVVSSMVKAEKIPWLQGIVGPDAPVVSAYGATMIPATFLVGPDGRIIARDLRGGKAREAIAKALGR